MSVDWIQDANQLFKQVIQWTQHQNGWTFKQETSDKYHSSGSGSPNVPVLLIETPQKERVQLEPMGQKGDGRTIVEMYAWPTLFRVWLQRKPGQADWEIATDAGVPFRRDWNEENFVNLVHDLSRRP